MSTEAEPTLGLTRQ